MANSFGNYFKEKIAKIREVLNSNQNHQAPPKPNYIPPNLSTFSQVSEEEVRKLILSSPSKSCDLDPCPTDLVKSCLDILKKPIANIINYSLLEGIFPSQFKKASVKPLLKKPSLPKEDFKNYRPVSNLNYLSKLTEKVVASKIKGHINNSKLDNPFQSAYKSFHSTETALLTIQNDIYAAMEKGRVTAVTLLDLSAAFDTIDHDLLLDRLSEWFGVKANALKWITSYLSQHFQSVSIQGFLSNPIELLYGVP